MATPSPQCPTTNNIKVKSYTFDFDDNILHLTSTARVYFKPLPHHEDAIIDYIKSNYSPELGDNIINWDPMKHTFTDFIACLPPNKTFAVDLTTSTPSSQQYYPSLFNVVNVTSCCSDYVKATDETHHTTPIFNTAYSTTPTALLPPPHCTLCTDKCIGVVVTTAQYANVRDVCFRKHDTYASFKQQTFFLSATFEALVAPKIPYDNGNKKEEGDGEGDDDGTRFDPNHYYGFLPRNVMVLESLYNSYTQAKAKVELRIALREQGLSRGEIERHPDLLALNEQQQKQQPPFRFLDLFCAYDNPTTKPRTTTEDQDAGHEDEDEINRTWRDLDNDCDFIVNNLKWMFESKYSPPVLSRLGVNCDSSGSLVGGGNPLASQLFNSFGGDEKNNNGCGGDGTTATSKGPFPSPSSPRVNRLAPPGELSDDEDDVTGTVSSVTDHINPNHNNNPNDDFPYGNFFPFDAFGPSLSRFIDSLTLHNFPVTIITSRGQPTWILQRAIIAIILYFCTEDQLYTMLSHISPSTGLGCLCEYVSHIPIFAVHSPSFLNWVGGTDDNHIPLTELNDPTSPINVEQLKREVYEVLKPEQPRSPEVYKCIAMSSYLKRLLRTDYHSLARTGLLCHDVMAEGCSDGEQKKQYYPNHHTRRMLGMDYTFTMGQIDRVPKQDPIYRKLVNRCYCNFGVGRLNKHSHNHHHHQHQQEGDDAKKENIATSTSTTTPSLSQIGLICGATGGVDGIDGLPHPPASPRPDNQYVKMTTVDTTTATATTHSTTSTTTDANSNPINTDLFPFTNQPPTTSQQQQQQQRAEKMARFKYSLGFSDDDKRNVDAMVDFFAKWLCAQYPQVKFAVYDTSNRGLLVKRVVDAIEQLL